MELLLVVGTLLAVLAGIVLRGAPRGTAACAAVGLAVGAGAVALRPGPGPDVSDAIPATVGDGGFVTSATCRACHPAEHASWHASYHRTMTRPATPEYVLGDFGDVVVEDHLRKRSYRFFEDAEGYWVEMVDPGWELAHVRVPLEEQQPPEPRPWRVLMTTGSHHLQAYWVEGYGGVYLQVPMVWHIAEARWIPSLDSFLTPPSDRPGRAVTQWNASCTGCHTVASQPHWNDPERDTTVAELGIACEACHGPAQEHVRAHLSPLRRYARHLGLGGEAVDDVVHPGRLDHVRSSQVCGQCHAFHKERDMDRWQRTGIAYRAGDDLEATKAIFRWSEAPDDPLLLEHLEAEPDALTGYFWGDGTMRVAGREYNALLETACHTRGTLSCLTCHSLHDYRDRSDQLHREGDVEATCVDCHRRYAEPDARLAHTHHPAGSAGDSCLNCHMPYTSYGLFTAMRSHRIDSPSAAVSATTGRPNACNQCHVDRPLDWTARHLTEWYGHEPVAIDADRREISETVRQAMKGDAAQRVLAAWTLGWDAAREAAGDGWQAPILAQLLGDPYAGVRYVAARALRTQPGFADFGYDFIAPAEECMAAGRRAIAVWTRRARPVGRSGAAGRAVLLDENGRVLADLYRRLVSERDDRPVRIIE